MKVHLLLNNLPDLAAFAKDAKLMQKPSGGFFLSGTIRGLEIHCKRKELIRCANGFFKEAQGYAFAETGGDFYSFSLICEKMRLLSASSQKSCLLFTKIRRLFGNLFYNWKREMLRLETQLFDRKLLYSAPRENELALKAKSELITLMGELKEEVPRLDNFNAFFEVGQKIACSHPAIQRALREYLKTTGVVDDVIAQVYYLASKEGWEWTLEEMRELDLTDIHKKLKVKDGYTKAIRSLEQLSFLFDCQLPRS